jgi:hypothetical protein
MKYYSEEEVIKLIDSLGYTNPIRYMDDMKPSTYPNRERIRMDLWREFASISINKADEALAAFDKQFPK